MEKMEIKNHTIKLIYDFDKKSFTPDNEPEVRPGETISFVLITIPPGESNFKVTMDETGYFDPSEANDSRTVMTLTRDLDARMTYSCQVIDAYNKQVFKGSGKYGGGVRPGK